MPPAALLITVQPEHREAEAITVNTVVLSWRLAHHCHLGLTLLLTCPLSPPTPLLASVWGLEKWAASLKSWGSHRTSQPCLALVGSLGGRSSIFHLEWH